MLYLTEQILYRFKEILRSVQESTTPDKFYYSQGTISSSLFLPSQKTVNNEQKQNTNEP